MFALWACSTSWRNIGPASRLICADSCRSEGSWSSWTSTIWPFWTTSAICTVPYGVLMASPVKVPEALPLPPLG